jgi:hypothetical protein
MKNLPIFNQSDFKISLQCRYGGIPRCVAVAHKNGIIAVKDTKNPDQDHLTFDKEEWAAFTAGIKNGEFDF